MYEKLQKLWVEETGLKVGDKVKILREFENKELGSSPDWNPRMSENLGKVGEVTEINNNFIGVDFDNGNWVYPFTVLEKIEEKKQDVPDTNREVLFLSSEDEWEIGFYCSDFRSWNVRGRNLGYLKLADGEVKKWKELPSKED